MKKTLFAIFTMAILAIPSQAQFKWGIEAGLNLSKISVSDISSNTKAGFFVGPKVQLTIPFIGLSVDGSVQYSQSNMSISSDDVSKNKSLPYVVIPVNLKYTFGLGSVAGIYISTGPQWNWYVGSSTSIVESDGSEFVIEPKSSSMNWNVGLGLHLIKHIQLGVTYSIAMNKGIEFKDIDPSKVVDGFSGRNNIWQVRLAYMF